MNQEFLKKHISGAVHQAVCEYTQSDGLGRCVLYALGAWLLANRLFEKDYILQAGSLYILADPPNGAVAFDVQHNGMSRGEFHCWVIGVDKKASRDDLSAHELIDLTSRHYRRMVEEQLQIAESVEIEGLPPVMLLAGKNRMRWSRDDEPPEFIWTTVDRQPDLIKVAPDEDCCKTLWDMTAKDRSEVRAFQQLCWRHFSKLCPSAGKMSRKIDANTSCPVQARQTPRVGRNAPCPCGSGKKFKRCCLRNAVSDTMTTPYVQGNTGFEAGRN